MEIRRENLIVETGDTEQLRFYPQVKFKRWDNLSNVSLRLNEDISKATIYITDNLEKVIFPDKECHLFTYSNSFEFAILLKRRPPRNYLDFTVVSKNCALYHQPELTKEEVSEGCARPEHVVNSIAVYSPFTHNRCKTGKISHLYRPYLFDADRKKEWCDLTVEKGDIVRLWMPSAFLTTAKYPVIVDPTFGYTTAGGTSVSMEHKIWCTHGTPASSGTIDSVVFYGNKDNTAQSEVRCGVYNDSSGPDTLLDEGDRTYITSTGAQWFTCLCANDTRTVTASTTYWVAAWADNASGEFLIYYDSAADSYYKSKFYNGAWDNPWTTTTYYNSRRMSIYCNYTETGGGGGLGMPLAMHHYNQLRRN